MSALCRAPSLLAFSLSLFMTLGTATSASDMSAATHRQISGDFNGDGRLDALFQPLSAGGQGAIVLQDGTGQLTVMAQQWNPGYLGVDWSAKANLLTTADLNGDTLDDVLVQPMISGKTAAVLITDPTSQLLQVTQLIPVNYLGLDWSAAGTQAVPGDFDGDRQKEFLMQPARAGLAGGIVHADPSGRLVVVTEPLADGVLGRRWNAADVQLYVGDFNGDGRQDLLMQVRAGAPAAPESAYALLLADPDGRFTRIAETWDVNNLGADWNPATHKLSVQTIDGVTSLVLTATDGSSNYVFQANSAGLFDKPAVQWQGTKSAREALAAQALQNQSAIGGAASPGNSSATTASSSSTSSSSNTLSTFASINSGAPSGNTPGTIHGKFSVDANGAANYVIPLDIPAGPNGLTPKLSLTYNSQSGPGLAGYGWTLSGLSAITRCGLTIAQDGNTQGVTFTDGSGGDGYCLDGQKLRADGSGNFRKEIDDASLITPNSTGGQGRATTNGPQWFQVKTKDGLTYKYGYTADSQVLAVGPAFSYSSCLSVSPVVVRVWALSSITDSAGNSINFTYANDAATSCSGDYWPTSITYGGSTGSQHKITFGYDDLRGISPMPAELKMSYRGGAAVGHTQRLNAVNILYSNNATPTVTYGLFYYPQESTTHYSELNAISECAGSTCYSPTVIGWDSTANQPGWTVSSKTSPFFSTFDYFGFAMDGFGIGSDIGVVADAGSNSYIDAFQINSNATGVTLWQSGLANYQGNYPDGTAYDTAWPINYRGNGATSILQPYPGTNGTTLHVFTLSPGGGGNMTFTNHDTGVIPYYLWSNFLVADVNGDGYDDIVWPKALDKNDTGTFTAGDTGLVVALNGPAGISNNPGMNGQAIFDDGHADNPPWLQGSRTLGFASGVSAADFNGDGRTDFVLNYGSYLEVKVSVGTQSAPQLESFGNVLDVAGQNPIYTLDVNGDGLTDLLYLCPTGATTCKPMDWMLAISTGRNAPSARGFMIIDTGQTLPPTGVGGGFVVDYEGDGRQDFMEDINGEWYVMSSVYVAGSGGSPGYYTLSKPKDTGLSWQTIPDSFLMSCPSGLDLTPVLVGDFNGDGLWDFITESSGSECPSGSNPATNLILHNPVLLHVNSITDGLGNNISVNYASISAVPSANIYTPGTTVPAHGAPFPGPLFVVSSYQASSGANNGDASNYTMSYTYQGAARDLQGRGFLGFNQIASTDSRNGEITTTTYDQAFPYIGFVDEQTVTNGSGATLLDTVNTPQKILTSGTGYTAAYFPYVQKSIVTTYGAGNHDGLSGGVVKTVQTINTYDSWGNLTKANIQTSPEPLSATGYFEENILSTYAEDSANWCLSLPSSVTVAKAFGAAKTTQGTTPTPGDISSGSYSSQARKTSYDVDTVNCRVNSKTDVAYKSAMSVKTTYIYQNSSGTADPWGNVDEVTIADGTGAILRDTVYDFTGAAADGSAADGVHPTSITDKNATTGVDLQVSQVWRQALGLLKSKTDVNNSLTVSWLYDAFGRKFQETEPDGTYTQWVYGFCYAGSLCPQVGAAYLLDRTHYSSAGVAGAFLRTKLDSFDRVVETRRNVTAANAGLTEVWEDTQFNALGLQVAHSAPYTDSNNIYWTTTAFDILNRPITITKPVQANTSNVDTLQIYYNKTRGWVTQIYAVDQVNTPTTVSDAPATETTDLISDSQGNTVEAADAKGGTTYATDAFGEVTSITDSASNTSTMDYDSVGHKVQQTDVDMGQWSYQYDALGELTSQTDANGNIITQNWDHLGRMYSRAESGPNGSATHSWTYDSTPHCVGKLGSETDNNGFTKVFNCDSFGRSTGSDTMIGTANPVDYNVTLGYDSFGRVQSVSYPVTAAPATGATGPTVSASATPASITLGGTVNLTGSATDLSGLPMTYYWTLSGPATSGITDPDEAQTIFAPSVPGNFTLNFVASDANAASSPASVAVSVAPAVPAAPNVPATNHTGSYTIQVGDSQGNPIAGADSYQIYESANGGGYTLLTTLSGNANTSYSVSNRGNGTYAYKATACGNGVCSVQSPAGTVTVTLPPGKPTMNAVSPGYVLPNQSFTVSWTKPSSGTVTYYLLLGDNNPSFSSPTPHTINAPATSWPNSLGTPGTYYYKVQACNGSSFACSDFSGVQQVVVEKIPGLPTITATPSTIVKYDQSTLNWSDSGYTVTAWHINGVVYSGSTTTTTVTGITTTTYSIYACNDVGCGGTSSVTVYVTAQGGCTKCAPVNRTGTTTPTPAPTPTTSGGPTGDISVPDSPMPLLPLGSPGSSLRTLNAGGGSPESAPQRDAIDTGDGSGPLLAANVLAKQSGTSTIAALPQAKPQLGLRPRLQAVPSRTSEVARAVPLNPALSQPKGARHLVQRPEAAYRALAEARRQAALPDILPPASARDQAAWRAANRQRDPLGPEYAPPVYIAYGGAKITPTTGSSYQFTVVYNYDSDENLLSVQDADTGFIYWENEGMDAFGHVTDEDYGNGLTTSSVYDAATGLVTSVQSGTATPSNFQKLAYTWDGYGNLNTRNDQNLGLTETFNYDALNRVGNSTVTGGSGAAAPINISYDKLGNILSKTAVGTYAYTIPGHPHQLATVTNAGQVTSYQYDSNGNIICSGGSGTNCAGGVNIRTVGWTPENQPSQVTYNGNTMNFAYDPEGQRYQEYSLASGATTGSTTLEIGDYAEVLTPDGGSPTYRMMVKAGSKTVAIHTIQPGGGYTDDYLDYDHLGSVDTITKDDGTLEQSGKMSFDVFGQHRCSSDWTASACDGAQTGTTDRGYTNQQQLDSVGLIHMEGRVYDPQVGRFMSADPRIQSLYNSQGLNRYTYVNNNPLNSTDPTGFDLVYAYYRDADGGYTYIPPTDNAVPVFTVTVPSTRALFSPSNPTSSTFPVNLADASDAPHVVWANSTVKPVDTIVINVERDSAEMKGLIGSVTVTSSMKDAPLLKGASLEPGIASQYPDLAAGWYQIDLVHSSEFSPVLKTDIPLVKGAVDDVGKSHGQVELHPGNTDKNSRMCELIGSKVVDTSNGPFLTSTRPTVKKLMQSMKSTIDSDSFSGRDTSILLHVVDPPPLTVPRGVSPP